MVIAPRHRWTILATLSALSIVAQADALRAGDAPPATDIQTLRSQYDAAHAAGDYAKALEISKQVVDLTFPQHLDALYGTAAMYCRLGDEARAYEWLQLTLDSGFWNYRRLLEDEDFASIRDQVRFKKITRAARIKQYLAMLERPDRADFQKPEQVMATLAFRKGERVADVGAGSGYFTLPVARAVGPEGIVWAIDIRQEMLDHIAARLEEEQVDNVRLKLVEATDPQLPPGGVDTILMVDTIHYVQDKAAYARKLREGMAPGGRVVIIDYTPKPFEERPWGPPPEQQVSRETLDAAFAEAGLKPGRVHDFLTEQYFVEYVAK